MSENNEELAVIAPAPAPPLALFGTSDPLEVIASAARVATALAQVVNERKLYALVNGKKFPQVEAWTLLGSMLGVFPVVEWVHELRDENGALRGFEARVQAQTLSGRIVGAGQARCIRGESKTWHANSQEFALASMAQTRATSKALRAPLDFVFKLAGFQPTPSEEMTGVDRDGVIANPSQASRQAVQQMAGAAPSADPPGPMAAVSPPVAEPAPAQRSPGGPRAKRSSNVVKATSSEAVTPQVVPVSVVEAAPSSQDSGSGNTPPSTPADDGRLVYLDTLRQQAREVAALVLHLRIKRQNIQNEEQVALGMAEYKPIPPPTPNPESDRSLAAFIANRFPGKALADLDEDQLAAGLDERTMIGGVISVLERIVKQIAVEGIKPG